MNKMMAGLAALVLAVGFGGTKISSLAAAATGDAPTTAPSTEAASSKFYGSVSAIDTTAKTFTVGEQTFTIGANTTMTKADGSTATLADAVVGEPARGTYTTAADGKTLTVTKVRFGKKVGGSSGKGGGKGGKKKTTEAPTTQQ